MSHCIYISLGSNINKVENTRRGLQLMQKHFGKITLSTVYESESVGFIGNAFINLVIMLHTEMEVADVIKMLKTIEGECGREKIDKKFCDRTLDLDLLLYDDLVIDAPVTLPREEILYNAFVLRPLAEIAPDMTHPTEKKTYQQLWQEYDNNKQKLWPIDFDWEHRSTYQQS